MKLNDIWSYKILSKNSSKIFLCFLSLIWEHSTFKKAFVISQTLKHVWDIFDFNTTSNLCSYLTLFVPKTPSGVWYFIIDSIPSKFHSYLALIESKSIVIFICFCCLIIFKLCKFTQTLHKVFSSPNLNSYLVFHYWNLLRDLF